MTRRHPLGERIFERFHRIPLVKGPKWRRGGTRASAGPFNRMTVRTLGYGNGLAAANALFVANAEMVVAMAKIAGNSNRIAATLYRSGFI